METSIYLSDGTIERFDENVYNIQVVDKFIKVYEKDAITRIFNWNFVIKLSRGMKVDITKRI